MDEAMLDSQAAMTKFLNLVAAEPDIARVPIMIDSSKWSVIEAGLKCVQGKAHRELDLAQGGRGGVRAAREARAPLRRGGRRDGLRREGPGRHARAQEVDLRALLPASSPRQVGFPAEDIIFDPNIFAIATGIEEHNRYGLRLHRGGGVDPPAPAAREDLGRRLEPLLLLPRQRPGARGDAHRVPLPRRQGRHDDGHRERRAARRLRGHPRRSARARRGRDLRPPPRRDRAPGRPSPSRSRAGRRTRSRTSPGAARPSRSASRTRW